MNETNKRLGIFLTITAILLIILSWMYSKEKNSTYLVVLMVTPMLSVIITRLITKEGLKNLFIKPNFKKSWNYYLVSYLGIPLVAFFGALIYFFIFPGHIDLLSSKFAFQSGIKSMGAYYSKLFMILPLCILINPITNIPSSFGEEFAWRGYLLPKLMEKYSTKGAVLITGIIWGLWHAPIVYMGFNYGTSHPILGIIMMIFFCSVVNMILSYLFLKSKSIWVPVVAHASINAIDLYTPVYLFTSMNKTLNPFVGPNLVGFIGGLGFILISICCYIKISKKL